MVAVEHMSLGFSGPCHIKYVLRMSSRETTEVQSFTCRKVLYVSRVYSSFLFWESSLRTFGDLATNRNALVRTI